MTWDLYLFFDSEILCQSCTSHSNYQPLHPYLINSCNMFFKSTIMNHYDKTLWTPWHLLLQFWCAETCCQNKSISHQVFPHLRTVFAFHKRCQLMMTFSSSDSVSSWESKDAPAKRPGLWPGEVLRLLEGSRSRGYRLVATDQGNENSEFGLSKQ